MPKSLNQCNFIGNLGADPESKYTPGGDCVTNFSIGVSDDYKDKSGNKVEQTEWVRVVAWRKLGEVCAEYLRKGSKVFVTGRIKTRSWEQDGVKRYSTELIAESMQMLDSKQDGGNQPAQQHRPATQQPQTDGFEDESIPF